MQRFCCLNANNGKSVYLLCSARFNSTPPFDCVDVNNDEIDMRLSSSGMFSMGGLRNQIYSAVCGYLGALSFGYVIGYSSPVLPQMTIFQHDDAAASWFGSIVTLGGIVGSAFAGWFLQRHGRRTTMLAAAIPYLSGWAFIYMGTTVNVLCIGRFLTGVGCSVALVAVPLYIGETASKDIRGMLGSGVQLSIAFGILLVYALGLTFNFRELALIGTVIPVLAVMLGLRSPESPRFLLDIGRKGEALATLSWLRESAAVAEEECRDMEEAASGFVARASLSDLFRRPELFRPLMIGLMTLLFQQLSGINVVVFYTVSIFQAAGFKYSSGMATVIIGTVQVIGTAVACVIMDRFGRRWMLSVAGLGMACSCLVLGICYKVTEALQPLDSGLSWLSLTSLVVYMLAFALGWGPVPILLQSEIFPARARGPSTAVVNVTNWFIGFVVTKSFASLQAALGMYGAFWLFGACSLAGVVYVIRYVPETKGKSLEDIELSFVNPAHIVAT